MLYFVIRVLSPWVPQEIEKMYIYKFSVPSDSVLSFLQDILIISPRANKTLPNTQKPPWWVGATLTMANFTPTWFSIPSPQNVIASSTIKIISSSWLQSRAPYSTAPSVLLNPWVTLSTEILTHSVGMTVCHHLQVRLFSFLYQIGSFLFGALTNTYFDGWTVDIHTFVMPCATYYYTDATTGTPTPSQTVCGMFAPPRCWKNGNFNPRKIWRVGLKANPVSSTFFLHPGVLRHTKNPFLSQRSQCELLSTYKSRWSIPISNTSLSWNTQSFIYNNSPLSSPLSIPHSEMYTHLFFLPFSLSTPSLRLCLMKTNLKSLPLTPSPPWIPNKTKQQQASPGLERRRATKWYNNWGYILPWIVSIVGGKGPEKLLTSLCFYIFQSRA